jgi:hypothetical protein
MLKVNCKTEATILLQKLVPFQGHLKKRKKEDIDALINSLEHDGMMMPFAVWHHEDKDYLLDGHGRLEALVRMSLKDMDIMTQELPCIYIEAATEDDARKSLLQITSSYGRIDKKGIVEFTATIPEYVAPCVIAARPRLKKRTFTAPKAFTRITIKVPVDKEADLRQILQSTPYIEIVG